ncbi:MAG: signal peptidase I [Haloarculaceae archaeon]
MGLLALVVVVALVVAALPGIIRMADSYVVRSSSMSPSIDAGSVVFVSNAAAADVEVGDVITFLRAGPDSRVTHRVVDIQASGADRAFKTKGDANEEPDPGYVGQDQVVGQVAFSVPLLGYLLSFAQSRLGVIALLIVPGVLLAANEVWGLYRETGTPGQGGDGQ